jgi:hypothetical protein
VGLCISIQWNIHVWIGNAGAGLFEHDFHRLGLIPQQGPKILGFCPGSCQKVDAGVCQFPHYDVRRRIGKYTAFCGNDVFQDLFGFTDINALL